jgi:FkbM family methyltransferase
VTSAVGDRLRRALLARAPAKVVQGLAQLLARSTRLQIQPDWRFDPGATDERQLTQLRRDIWSYYRDKSITEPVIFRWYDDLRVRLFLGNDLSLCLFAGGSFEPNEFAFLRAFLQPGMIVLDGGANDGLYSLYSARRVGRNGRVLAVEPSAREFDRLIMNVKLNRLGNVRPLRAALLDRVGEATLAIAEPGHEGLNAIGNFASSATVRTVSHERVAHTTIDALVEDEQLERLDFVKLDLEGSEVAALEGSRAAVSRFRPIILLEAEDERLASQGKTKQELADVVKELGYSFWVFDADSAQLRTPRPPEEPEGNAVAAPSGWYPPVIA